MFVEKKKGEKAEADEAKKREEIGLKELMRNLKGLLAIMINEDIDCQNDEVMASGGKERLQHIDERYVGRYIDLGNINQISADIMESFRKGMPEPKPDEENDPNVKSE